jgi:hypothetical protein
MLEAELWIAVYRARKHEEALARLVGGGGDVPPEAQRNC